MSASRNRPIESGFTLIEVLVVVSIIAILAAVIFPTFASVKMTSKSATCQSNLKQLYSAFQMYAQDWSDTFPCPGGQVGSHTYWAQDNGGGVDVYLRSQHMGLRSVYCCPAYAGRWGETRYSPRTYGMNSYLRTPADVPYPACIDIIDGITLGAIISSSETILLYEGIPASTAGKSKSGGGFGEGYVPRCGDWSSVRGFYPNENIYVQTRNRPWHGARNNYLMCDGHIMSMAPEKSPGFKGPTSDRNNHWYAVKYREGSEEE